MARVTPRRIKLREVGADEDVRDVLLDIMAEEGFEQAGELHQVADVGEASAESWVEQLRSASGLSEAPVFQVYRLPEGGERIPRALCFAWGDPLIAFVTRRAREMAYARPDHYMRASAAQPLPRGPATRVTTQFQAPQRFVLSRSQYFQCCGNENANDMWSWLCEMAGVAPEAVGPWGQIDRRRDRRFDVQQLLKFGQPSERSNHIPALRDEVGDQRAEIWEIASPCPRRTRGEPPSGCRVPPPSR